MVQDRLKLESASDAARKQAEIENAWALHRLSEAGMNALRRRQWLREHLRVQNGRCKYCQVRISESLSVRAERATIDHVVAMARGGADEAANTVASCAPCNVAKGDQPVDAFFKSDWLRSRIVAVARPPDRLSVDPRSPHYDAHVLSFGVDIIFNGRQRHDVVEYCVSEGWVRVRVKGSKDRRGKDIILKIVGNVEPRSNGWSAKVDPQHPAADDQRPRTQHPRSYKIR